MGALKWSWAAVLLEISLFWSPHMQGHSLGAFVTVLALHTLASAIVASGSFVFQPKRFRRPRLMVWLLLFSFAFIAPVFGAIGMLLIIRGTLKRDTSAMAMAIPVSVELPEYDVQTKDANRSGQGAIRSRLGSNVPGNIRMQSLLTLQAVPNRVSNPILEGLLGDSTDDVRLVAFGMLDAEEKKLNSLIQRERKLLEEADNAERRFNCFRQLAELHWELIYASLAQGELRDHILGLAAGYVDAALNEGLPATAALSFLRGRILLAQGNADAAKTALEESLALGQPLISVIPYLAEMAFKRRDFVQVRKYMDQLAPFNVASSTRAIVDVWIGRDRVSNFSDRRFFPHI